MTSLAGATALVVDDSPAVRGQLAEILRQLGLSCDEAPDGVVACQMLSTGTYDLLVTDVQMPVLDGLKLIALVRAGGPHREVPIVVVSSESAQVRDRALALGADAYLPKPVQARQVADAVRALIGVA